MELREYTSIRRAYNLVRQRVDSSSRLTFAEFAILCRLLNVGTSLKTSEIAEYQGSLRPTMTHRTKHLSKLGLIERDKGDSDRRNVVCTISDAGVAYVHELCESACKEISAGHALARTTPERICRYADAMGSVPCTAGELTLLGLYEAGVGSRSISQLVEDLGLLQPTVSMSVAALEQEGMITRVSEGEAKTLRVALSEAGRKAAEDLIDIITDVIVRRKPRKH